MADDDEFSDHVSVDIDKDDDYNMNSAENHSDSVGDVNGTNSDDNDIDDATLFNSLKELRRITKCFERHSCQGVQRRSRKKTTVGTEASKGKCDAGCSKAVSRCNPSYFREIISLLDQSKRDLINNLGFGILLEYDDCAVPRNFVQWLADQVDVNCLDILVGGKVIPICPNSMHMSLCLPIGGQNISKMNLSKLNF